MVFGGSRSVLAGVTLRHLFWFRLGFAGVYSWFKQNKVKTDSHGSSPYMSVCVLC